MPWKTNKILGNFSYLLKEHQVWDTVPEILACQLLVIFMRSNNAYVMSTVQPSPSQACNMLRSVFFCWHRFQFTWIFGCNFSKQISVDFLSWIQALLLETTVRFSHVVMRIPGCHSNSVCTCLHCVLCLQVVHSFMWFCRLDCFPRCPNRSKGLKLELRRWKENRLLTAWQFVGIQGRFSSVHNKHIESCF